MPERICTLGAFDQNKCERGLTGSEKNTQKTPWLFEKALFHYWRLSAMRISIRTRYSHATRGTPWHPAGCRHEWEEEHNNIG